MSRLRQPKIYLTHLGRHVGLHSMCYHEVKTANSLINHSRPYCGTCANSLSSLSCSLRFSRDVRHTNIRVPSSIFFRGFNNSKIVDYPRFKLSFADTEADKNMAEEKSNDENLTYLKSHAYRKVCPFKSKSELASVLVNQVIHNKDGLFVTNKPFGVGVRTRSSAQKQRTANHLENMQLHLRGIVTCPHTLEDALPDLRILLKKPELTLVRSTEKLTSGVAVFADNEELGKKMSKAVKSSKSYYRAMYKYHVITVLPPTFFSPEKTDRVGLTIKPGEGSDLGQPVILHDFSKNSVKRTDVHPIYAQIRIIKSGFNGGHLVEICCSSIENNFLRIYCADKLAPILGDHLYSSRVQTLKGIPAKIDPTHLKPGSLFQKLPAQMLDALQLLKPEDSIMVPPHVHLRSYKVRRFLGKNVEMEMEAPYPSHFKWTCQRLGITLDEEALTYTSEQSQDVSSEKEMEKCV